MLEPPLNRTGCECMAPRWGAHLCLNLTAVDRDTQLNDRCLQAGDRPRSPSLLTAARRQETPEMTRHRARAMLPDTRGSWGKLGDSGCDWWRMAWWAPEPNKDGTSRHTVSADGADHTWRRDRRLPEVWGQDGWFRSNSSSEDVCCTCHTVRTGSGQDSAGWVSALMSLDPTYLTLGCTDRHTETFQMKYVLMTTLLTLNFMFFFGCSLWVILHDYYFHRNNMITNPGRKKRRNKLSFVPSAAAGVFSQPS